MYLLLLAVAYFAETTASFRDDKCVHALEEKTFEPSQPYSYNRVLDIGFREKRFRRVRVIALSEGVEPDDVVNNPCVLRMFLAKLVRRLGEKGAAVIVIDRWFPARSCPERDAGTEDLISALKNSTVPIVLGLHTVGVAPNANTKSCLQASPRLVFGEAESSPRVRFGLVRLDSDTRKLPLQWSIYNGKSDDFSPTLALSAAELADHDLGQENRLGFLIKHNVHPYARFVPSATYPAIKFLCGLRVDWKTCSSPGDSEDNDVRGRVVVIGFTGPTADMHHAENSDLPGVVLHANYIEALLDGGFYIPISGVWLFVVWYVVMHLLFWRMKSPELAAGLAFALGLVFWVGAYLVLTVFGLLLTSWLEVSVTTFLLAILVRYVDARGHRGIG